MTFDIRIGFQLPKTWKLETLLVEERPNCASRGYGFTGYHNRQVSLLQCLAKLLQLTNISN